MIRWRPNLHDVYVGRVVLVTVMLVWAVLVGLDAMQGLSSELGNVGKIDKRYSFGHALAFVAYTVPRRAYTMFPTAAVIGALMGLGQLAASSELTALRALGLSRRRLSLSVAVALALLTGLMVLGMETVGAWGQQQAESIKARLRYGDVAMARYSGLWAREGNIFLNAQSGEEKKAPDGRTSLELRDVRLYELDADGRLTAISHAASAEQIDRNWVLKDVQRTAFQARAVVQTHSPEERWASKLDPAALAASIGRPRYMAASDLSRAIDYRMRNGLDAREYEEVYWGRWFYAFNVLALCLAAVPFAFGSLRSGGLGKRMFLGLLFALGFWLMQMLFARMAGAFKLDYRLAYALPPVLMLLVSGWLFRRRSS